MSRNTWNPDSLFWKPLGSLADLVLLSLLFALCSLPVVTFGASAAALYDCVAHGVRQKEDGIYTRFFRTFRTELKNGIIGTLVWGAVLVGYVFLCRTLGASGSGSFLTVGIALVPATLLAGLTVLSFALQSRFEQSYAGNLSNAVRLGLAHPLRTLVSGGVSIILFLLCLRFIAPIIFAPGVAGLVNSYLFEPIFRRFS